MIDNCMQGPTGLRFTLGGYEFRHYRKGQTTLRGRWEATKHGRGVGGARTPLDAWWRLRKWLAEPLPRPSREGACDRACNGTWPSGPGEPRRPYHVRDCPNDAASDKAGSPPADLNGVTR